MTSESHLGFFQSTTYAFLWSLASSSVATFANTFRQCFILLESCYWQRSLPATEILYFCHAYPSFSTSLLLSTSQRSYFLSILHSFSSVQVFYPLLGKLRPFFQALSISLCSGVVTRSLFERPNSSSSTPPPRYPSQYPDWFFSRPCTESSWQCSTIVNS